MSDDLREWPRVLAEEVRQLYEQSGPLTAAEIAQLESATVELDEIQGILSRLQPGQTCAHTALCLSGGGIRSSSFALGVLQGLAEAGHLEKFRYLSTVSGGGYAGGWLSAWIHHCGGAGSVSHVAKQLGSGGMVPAPLARLRASTNFLTPRLGVLSADWWAVVALFARNLLLNWLILLPLAFGALLIPQAVYQVWSRNQPDSSVDFPTGAVWGLVALFAGLCAQLANRPSWGLRAWPGRWVALGIVGPQLIAAFLLASFAMSEPPPHILSLVPIAACGVFILSWLSVGAAWLLAGGKGAAVPLARSAPRGSAARDFIFWSLCGALFAAGLWGLARVSQWDSLDLLPHPDPLDAWRSLAFGLPAVLLLRTLCDMLFTGLISSDRVIEDDREWSGRFNGCLGIAAAVWTVVMTASLAGGPLLVSLATLVTGNGAPEHLSGKTAVVGGVAGAISALLSWSSKTFGLVHEGESKLREKVSADSLLIVVSLIFIVIAMILLGVTVEAVLAAADADDLSVAGYLTFSLLRTPFDWLDDKRLALAFGLMVVCIGVALIASLAININRFNQQGIYRNRLIRGFLGPTRSPRHPNPFTGFDERDNIAMADLWTAGREPRLFPIVNMTLNLAATTNPAWMERKAGAFAATPLRVGADLLGYRATRDYAGPNGITLGMAMAISGAAVSPNQGYHSSAAVALLMTLFNVRLGAWLGNPRNAKASRRMGPLYAALPLLREAFLQTREDSGTVYLSDGGHFENLGLYEAVRRRCRLILVSDAGCDPDMQFADLGNAIRKIFIDFGIEISFPAGAPAMPTRPEKDGVAPAPAAGKYWAVAEIRYPDPHLQGKPGTLIYLKPAYYGDEPPDIRAFALVNKQFPHDTTLNQWFTESQFESYRHLGRHCVREMMADPAISAIFKNMV